MCLPNIAQDKFLMYFKHHLNPMKYGKTYLRMANITSTQQMKTGCTSTPKVDFPAFHNKSSDVSRTLGSDHELQLREKSFGKLLSSVEVYNCCGL